MAARWPPGTVASASAVTCSHRRPGRVVAVGLNSTGLDGALSPAIGYLTFLRTLDLSFNSLHGGIPASLGRLRHLQELILNNNFFSGKLPGNLSSCVSMTEMVLQNNKLGGNIPAELGEKLKSLAVISLRNNSFTGPIPASLANLSHLQILDLTTNQLVGSIPSGLGSIQSMQYFGVFGNLLAGMLPPSLYNWSTLEVFDVGENMLYGSIPDDMGSKFPKLKHLGLVDNHFTVTIPSSVSNVSFLEVIDLGQNRFSGCVPPTLGKLGALQYLDLNGNKLEANDNMGWEFITSLANCSRLQVLGLSNPFEGQLPGSIVNLSTTLQWLYLMDNRVSGSIPADIGNLVGLKILMIANTLMYGVIPESIGKLGNLIKLQLFNNRLSGYVPPALGKLGALQLLNLSDNNFEANDNKGWEFMASLANCSQLELLELIGNSFGGQLPGSIVNLSTTLRQLYLQDNVVSGSIPADIGNLVGLNRLVISRTSISGVIPKSIGKLENLMELGLYQNSLSGLIPSALGNLSQLNRLYAYGDNLEGPIPASLGELKNLFVLDLSANNRLNGSIPREIFKLSGLSWMLDLSYNSLSGPIPNEVGSLANLNLLILSGNRLSGKIPDSLQNCRVLECLLLDNNSFEGSIPQSLENLKGLNILNLTMNKFSGNIPEALGSIGNLQGLYLAHNDLSGSIPSVLQNLTSLSELDISFNNLQGEVPNEGIFRNITYLAIAGNNNLCGGTGTPQLHLVPCSTSPLSKNGKKMPKSLVISLATAGAILFSLSVILLVWILRKKLKHSQKTLTQNSIADDHYKRIPYHALFRGTDEFSEANLLGRGSYGAVYKCVLDTEEKPLAVKVFNLGQSRYSKSFEAECEAMRRIRHRCLIKIITSCSSVNHHGQEFKALVFEFMHNGNLDGWLHPKSQEPTTTNTLSLAQRLEIAVDIVDAVEYLHNYCQPLVIHCDLKPSNILLDENMSARVGDFGISRIIQESASEETQTSYSSTGIRGSIGYVAPEYGEGSVVSTAGDIYSLGILLLKDS